MNKRTTNRLLALLLALMLSLQLFPLSAFAAETEPELGDEITVTASDEAPASEAVDVPQEQSAEDASAPEDSSPAEAEETAEEPSPAETQDPVEESSPAGTQEEEAPVVEPEDPNAPEVPSEADVAVPEEPTEAAEVPTQLPSEASEEPALSEQELAEQAVMDQLDAMLADLLANPRRATAGSYASELAKFPASYQTALKALHAKHPNWVFVAVNTGLDWNKVIAAETGERSTMEYNEGPNSVASHLLLNNRDGYYSSSSYSSTLHYKPLDGRFVSASRAAVSYYMDPRNFLTENYIFQFESETFSEIAQVAGVTAILRSGCNTSAGMANKTTYVTTGGKTAKLSDLSSQFGSTYPQIIYNVGKLLNVSPYFIASKIVQETSANTTTKVLTGTQSGYVGYYNFFNIGAYASASGNAWQNGLKYAKNHGWFNPIVAIKGGVEFLSDKYISKGQNTAYYMRFNVSPESSYALYDHQYMSATAAAAGEGSSTFKGYQDAGAQDSAFLFYIPVYLNMPEKTSVVSLTPTTTGKTTAQQVLYNVPAATGSKLVTVPKGTSVTILGGSITSSDKYENRLFYPYWYQVKVTVSGKSYTGYLHEQEVSVNQVYHLKPKATKSISGVTKITGGYSGPIYYETSDPSVATVSATTGLIQTVGAGSCTIYAISGGGSFDAIGIKVSSSGSSASDKETNGPSIGTPVNTSGGTTGQQTSGALSMGKIANQNACVRITWNAYSGADFYRVYRKTGSSSWVKLTDSFDTYLDDYDVTSGTAYTYTVRASVKGSLTPYNSSATLSIVYLDTPYLYSADVASNGVTVSWEKVSGAKGYQIYRKEDGGKWTLLAKLSSASTTSYLDSSSFTVGKEYIYTVRALSGSTLSAYDASGVSCVILQAIAKLGTVQIASASNATNGVKVKWKAVSGAEGYRVYRKKSGDAKWTLLGSTSALEYTDTKAVSGSTCTYTVRACKGSTLGGYDKDGKSVLYLATPALVSAQASAKSITFQWKTVSGAKGYNVYRKTESSSWKLLKKVGRGTSSYADSNVTKGIRYLYTVRAYSGSTLSAYVAAGKSAIAGVTLATPVLTGAANRENGIELSWNKVSGATSYYVYRKGSTGDWKKLATVTTLRHLDTTTNRGSDYRYTVKAVKGGEVSDFDAAGIALRRLAIPSLSSATAGAKGITVKWGSVSGAKTYRLYRKNDAGKWALVASVTGTSYTDNKGLIKGNTYTYTVRAAAGSSLSSYSSKGISAKAAANGTEVLKTYVTTGSLNYRTGAGSSYPVAGTFASGAKVSVVVGGNVTAGTTVWYRVKVNNNYYYASSKYMKAS